MGKAGKDSVWSNFLIPTREGQELRQGVSFLFLDLTLTNTPAEEMNTKALFSMALGIEPPWYIKDINFDQDAKRLDIHIDFEHGAVFHYEDKETGFKGDFKAYDTVEKTWRHLNFFQHECYLRCRTPRVDIGGGKARLVSPPWEGRCNGFTMLFEALVMQLCAYMPVNSVARLVSESDDKIWSMLGRYVEEARQSEDYEGVKSVGMDETSRAKGHEYVTLFVDMERKRTIYVAEGKDAGAVKDFASDFEAHGGDAGSVEDVSCDMSPAFISGVKENLPKAKITFDRFHIMKILNQAVDNVRRNEVYDEVVLRKSKYLFLKNRDNLSVDEAARLKMLENMPDHNLKTVRALHIRENFQDIYKVSKTSPESFEPLLKKWYMWALHSRLQPMVQAARTVREHWEGIVNWHKTMISNGIHEGLNSLIQAAKAKARGYRTLRNFKIIAYVITGGL